MVRSARRRLCRHRAAGEIPRHLGRFQCRYRRFHGFADHHPYRDAELQALALEATETQATLVTTEKDWVRLSPEWRARIQAVKVALRWDDEAAIETLLDQVRRG